MLIVVMIRSRKSGSVTMINYLSASFMYCKVASLVLWTYADVRAGIIYGVLFLGRVSAKLLTNFSIKKEFVFLFCEKRKNTKIYFSHVTLLTNSTIISLFRNAFFSRVRVTFMLIFYPKL